MNSRWSDDLRERMAEYEMPAPEALFEQIEEAMPASQPAPLLPLWRRWVAVAAAVAVVAGGYLLFDRPLQPSEELLSEVAEVSALPSAENETEQMQILEPVPQNAQIAVAEKSQKITKTIVVADNNPSTEIMSREVEEVVSEQSAPTEQMAEQGIAEKSAAATESALESARVKQQTRGANNYYAMMQPQKRTTPSARLSANIFASGSAAGHSIHSAQQVFQVNSSLFGEMSMAGSTTTPEASNGMLLYSDKELLKTDIHHSQPVRFGFSLRYHFTERWALESGLTYSILYSRSQMGHTSNYSTDRQTLHYLGLPVSGVYNVWSNKRFVLYLSAGAMIEKCVSGSIKTSYTINGVKEKSQRKDLMVDELQFSAMASAGAQVNLSPLVGLYVEPGVGYWFDNGSAVQTIYGEQPFNFNLNLGLRFTLR